MRETKFRVYAKGLDEGIYYPNTILISQGKVSKAWTDDFKLKDDTNEFILMQFTGLKDKNGKEIYEGDIVELFDDVLIIESSKTGWECKMIKGVHKGTTFVKSYLATGATTPEYKVIGNIYEHKHLLNGLQ